MTIAVAVVMVFGSAVRLQFDGRPFRAAMGAAVRLSLLGSVLALPLSFLARAYGAHGSEASFVFIAALVTINVVNISLTHLQEGFAGNPHVQRLSFRLVWDACLLIIFFALAYFVLGITPEGKLGLSLADSLYLSAITLTTTGYGDVVPPLPARPLAMLESFLGYALLGLWVATLFQNAITSQRKGE